MDENISVLTNLLLVSDNDVKDPELDILSETFNPLKALHDKSFIASSEKPKVQYQNMAAFETAFNRVGIFGIAEEVSTTKKKPNTNSDEELQPPRRFEEYQMPIRSNKTMKSKHRRNILTKMTQYRGPLEQLYRFIETERRVRVTVRRKLGVKGYLEGYLQAFDSHWNLLLTDVVESYSKRKNTFTEQNVVFHNSEAKDCFRRLRSLGIPTPKETANNVNRKTVKITRNVAQLVLRGEHVIMIRTADEDI